MKKKQIKNTATVKKEELKGLVIIPNNKKNAEYSHSIYVNGELVTHEASELLGLMDFNFEENKIGLMLPLNINDLPENIEMSCFSALFYKNSDIWGFSKEKGVFSTKIIISTDTFALSFFSLNKFIELFKVKIEKIKGVKTDSLWDSKEVLPEDYFFDVIYTPVIKKNTTINNVIESFKKEFIPVYKEVMKLLLTETKKEVQNL